MENLKKELKEGKDSNYYYKKFPSAYENILPIIGKTLIDESFTVTNLSNRIESWQGKIYEIKNIEEIPAPSPQNKYVCTTLKVLSNEGKEVEVMIDVVTLKDLLEGRTASRFGYFHLKIKK